jgi:malate synthase
MIETLMGAVNMEEMLYEIRDHCCGLNAGRWDYIFSIIKRLQIKTDAILPDRKQVTIHHDMKYIDAIDPSQHPKPCINVA